MGIGATLQRGRNSTRVGRVAFCAFLDDVTRATLSDAHPYCSNFATATHGFLPGRTTQQKKGFFGLFRKSAPAPAPVPPPQRSATLPSAGAAGGAAQPPAATRYQSATAAAAAARWLGRGTGVPAGGDGGAAGGGGPSLLDGGATTSLLAARVRRL